MKITIEKGPNSEQTIKAASKELAKQIYKIARKLQKEKSA